LLTGKKRLPGFEKQSGFRQTEIGMIPIDWGASNLSSISKQPMQNGVFPEPSRKGSGIRVINVGDLYGRVPIDPESLELFGATEMERARFRVEDGDLFFTRSSLVPSGIAHCNIYSSSEPAVFDSHVIRLRPDIKKVAPSYLFRFCGGSIARHFLVSHAKTATMTTIDQRVLGNCPVALPSRAEQEAIAEALGDVDAEVALQETKLAKVRKLKQGMLQELLAGRIRFV
jgi:type I restriction enzyme S subunit